MSLRGALGASGLGGGGGGGGGIALQRFEVFGPTVRSPFVDHQTPNS